ncbi:FIST N-terminal domain-containing protein [Zoogloea sp. 1C4]|uniref:FIST N-terminal domain-containing protein n=1 Tax=Zoogloea sp. 1C4 TaxID=2570190 RepID=UPI0012920633|nr:FIST N-terminal domain-containing protein [Zoogloea sp. 1C4]
MDEASRIRRAQTRVEDAREAVRAFHAGVVQDDMALVVFFCASSYDLDAIADEMRRCFAGVQVVGCTSAGEIGPGGYLEHSLAGVSFGARDFTAASGCITRLQDFDAAAGQALARHLQGQLDAATGSKSAANRFALLLIDGLSVREEAVTRAIQSALGVTPLVGGSAADGSDLGRTLVYADGQFHNDAAVLTLVATSLPFRLFDTHHFEPTDERLVVTSADPARRVVREINGLPAAQEFARILGVAQAALTSEHFAGSPVMVIIGGASYIRSIRKANPDGSLTFFCAIENGLILRVGRSLDLHANLQGALARVRGEIGPPQLVLGCDCVLRRVEILQSADRDAITAALQDSNIIGFNTYGEQFRGVHLNQTLAAIAIGAAGPEVKRG